MFSSVLTEVDHLEFCEEVERRFLSPNPDHTWSLGFKAVWLVSLLSDNPPGKEAPLPAAPPSLPKVLGAEARESSPWPSQFLQEPSSPIRPPKSDTPLVKGCWKEGALLSIYQTQAD